MNDYTSKQQNITKEDSNMVHQAIFSLTHLTIKSSYLDLPQVAFYLFLEMPFETKTKRTQSSYTATKRIHSN